jgi:hypothetical protein
MKTKIFIVTYQRTELLDHNLKSLYGQLPSHAEVVIINNHSNFQINYPAKVLHNSLRPDFSTGHLARNWNQAIIHGFQDLNQPDCDLLITCQDDTIWQNNAFDKIYQLMEKYNFITDGLGDNFCVYRPEAIKQIGLWDERFCGIGYQEADYFLQAVITTPDKCSINDFTHGRIHNPHHLQIIQHPRPGFHDATHIQSMKFHHYNEMLFAKKWGIKPDNWQFPLPQRPLIPDYVYYPYFECKINKWSDMV